MRCRAVLIVSVFGCCVVGCGDQTSSAELQKLQAEVQRLQAGLEANQAQLTTLMDKLDKSQAAPDASPQPQTATGLKSGIIKEPKFFAGRAGTKLERVLLVKSSGTGHSRTSHLMNIRVSPPEWKKGGAELVVAYELEVLDDTTVASYCGKTGRRYYDRQAQGWWLELGDGARLEARYDGYRAVSRKKPKEQKCQFKMTDAVSAAQRVGMKLIYVPANDVVGWPKDDLNRSRAQVTVELGP